MIITFKGPEGAPFVGKTFPAKTMDDAPIKHVADFQRATGLRMDQVQEAFQGADILQLQAMAFFSLRLAGHTVSWATLDEMRMSDCDVELEPGDEKYEEYLKATGKAPAPEAPAGPTAASTASPAPVDAVAPVVAATPDPQ